MNGYELSRSFWDWSFENPDKIKPIHAAIYFFAVEHCNRLGWKEKFGLPSQMVMEAIGVKNWRTYSVGLNDLVDFNFIKMIEKSKNQYSSNIIALVNFTKAPTKALDKALQKHGTKQSQGTVSIDKQETINNKQSKYPTLEEFVDYAQSKARDLEITVDLLKVKTKYIAWSENDWKTNDDKPREIKNWKSTLTNSLQYMKGKPVNNSGMNEWTGII